MKVKISKGEASSVRILVADELGLNPPNVHLAKMYLDGTLHSIQFANLENSGGEALKMIIEADKLNEANELAGKYFNN